MKVKINYFRTNGKWYTEAEYDTVLLPTDPLYLVWDEVERRLWDGDAPGLSPRRDGSAYGFMALVDVPDHPHRHPHIVGVR